ncbi:U1 small nuclear ribonucleoprotein C-like [Strongylocentrotus purpuratus]|uniref:Integrase zinc-binding domain-containing protein n=1 Tax=Strongylocentrotus purpuratus TaxID=7668 RepID=A0A7M7HJS0_STRPU|nr:U1 small nuclear ribonucleoprotein C-like [Strongylocentrotus purpuratus]
MSELESEVPQPSSSPPNCLQGLEPKLLHHQKLDKDLEDIRHMVTNNTRPTVKEIRRSQPGKRRLLWQLSRLSIHNDILYRTKMDEKRSVKLYQAIVPESLVQEVLKLLHGHPTSGHFSAERTLERAKSSYFWPYIHRDVLDFCEKCRACETIRSPHPSNHAPLKNRLKPYRVLSSATNHTHRIVHKNRLKPYRSEWTPHTRVDVRSSNTDVPPTFTCSQEHRPYFTPLSGSLPFRDQSGNATPLLPVNNPPPGLLVPPSPIQGPAGLLPTPPGLPPPPLGLPLPPPGLQPPPPGPPGPPGLPQRPPRRPNQTQTRSGRAVVKPTRYDDFV